MNNLDNFVSQFAGYSDSYFFYDNTVEIVFDKAEHTYKLVQGEELIEVPSVTTVCHIIDKSQILIPWACKMMGERITGSLPSLIESNALNYSNLEDIIFKAKFAWKDKLEAAGDVGTIAHNWIEQWILNTLAGKLKPEYPSDPQAHKCCLAAEQWAYNHNVRWMSTETKVFSRNHQYAGTRDGKAYVDSCNDRTCCPYEFKDKLGAIDWKTGTALYLEYLFQLAAYVMADLEEHPDQKIEDFWVIHLGRDDGEFNPWHIDTNDELEMYYYGFLNCLRLYRSVEHAEQQVKLKKENVRAAKREAQKKLQAEQYKLKCKGADKYKGKRKPVCNDGHPCEYCLKKYAEVQGLTSVSST
jgi:hypothetical protein